MTDRMHHPSDSHGSNRRTVLALLTIAALNVAVLWPVVTFDFVEWDDPHNILEHPRVRSADAADLLWHWRNPTAGLYIPLTYTLWKALAQVGDAPQAAVFHAASLLIHVLSAGLVYLIATRLMPGHRIGIVAAALFALHPVQVEAVAWVSGMKDLLFTLLTLVAIWQFILFAQSPPDARRRTMHYVGCIVAFVAALLSKPTAVVTPLILLAVAMLALRLRFRRALVLVLPMLVLAIPCAIWTRQVQPARTVHTLVPPPQRVFVAADALAFYAYKIAVPIRLAPDYGRSPRHVIDQRVAYVTWVVPAALAAMVWRVRRIMPLVALGASVFVLGLLPVLGFIPFDYQAKSTTADHYLYLPMAGIALAAAALLHRFNGRQVRAMALLVLLLWAGLAHAQTWHWRATGPLFEHTLAVNPRSWVALTNLASRALAEERFSDAERLAREAVTVRPDHVDAWHNLGSALALQGRLPEAAEAYRRGIDADPNLPDTHTAYAFTVAQIGQRDLAIAHFERALQIDPEYQPARELLSQLRRAPPALSETERTTAPGATPSP
jgi:protein O-mannosyl-transferase